VENEERENKRLTEEENVAKGVDKEAAHDPARAGLKLLEEAEEQVDYSESE
jgi:hypothetical protein